MPSINNALPAGTPLNNHRYEVVETLSHGGFGITYLVREVATGRLLAMKEFFVSKVCMRDTESPRVGVTSPENEVEVADFRQKFLKEARTISQFRENPHIIDVFDVFEENDTAYYVMAYIAGGTLQQLVERAGRLAEEKALDYIRQMADALRYIHSRQYVHLDVKPSNAMLNSHGEVVLIDFGVSKHYDHQTGHETTATPVARSAGYAPMEQYTQEVHQFSPATDIYSLGATLWFLLSGQRPPEAHTLMEDGLPSQPQGVSDQTWAAITAAMQPARRQRPQTIDAFLQLLPSNAPQIPESEVTVISSQPPKKKAAARKTATKPSLPVIDDFNDLRLPEWCRKVYWANVFSLCLIIFTAFVEVRKMIGLEYAKEETLGAAIVAAIGLFACYKFYHLKWWSPFLLTLANFLAPILASVDSHSKIEGPQAIFLLLGIFTLAPLLLSIIIIFKNGFKAFHR